MAEVLAPPNPRQELARALEVKVAQGHTIESQTDTEAVLMIKGNRRLFRPSNDSRQVVSVDEGGHVSFKKV